jgi:crossover junction endodeoxyribonuclease RusA
MAYTVRLPFPPSTNNLFATVDRNGRGGTIRVRARPYVSWSHAARMEFLTSRRHHFKRPVVAEYVYGRPDNRRRDVANYEKAISDLLVEMNVLDDDTQIEDIRLRWATPADSVPAGVVLVRISEVPAGP